MVTQKIVTRLSNDVLPPVRMVSGDVGREIQLEIYANDESLAPIDLETYSARITIIKPDKTFVIQDFDKDKVELPKQAGAVTGHGYYQIKIYTAGDHQIYTGQGPFIVDDDVLSDEMIESVAEVNGYEFPDDFLTDADLREYVTKYELEDALAGIIDDDTTDYNSTWSSAKINEVLSSVTKTATGNPIEFSDGADAPLVKCTTAITGSQDLHGYDKPWVGGAGKNKCNGNMLQGYWAGSDGSFVSSNTYISTDKIVCKPNTYYTISADATYKVGNQGVCWYDSNGDYISFNEHRTGAGAYVNWTFQSPENAKYMAYDLQKNPNESTISPSDITHIQIEEGQTATAWTPYSNICPITAYNQSTISVEDENEVVQQTSTATFSSIYQGNADFVGSKATATWGYIASYNGETLPGEWISSMDEYAPGTTPTTGAQVAYKLSTPTTSPVAVSNYPIKSLSGYNHIESSTGEMEVKYITQTYDAIMEATKLDNMKVYSTDEQVVGKWVDGSDLKEKTYVYTGTGVANPFTTTIDFTGKSIVEVIPHYVKFTYGGGTVGYCAGSALVNNNSNLMNVAYDDNTPPTVRVTCYIGSGTETYEVAFTIRYI